MADAATASSPEAAQTDTAGTDNGAATQAADATATDTTTSSDASTAQSSSADTDDKRTDREKLLDVTRKALEKKPAADGASSSSEAKTGDTKDAKTADQADAAADPDADLPFHKHPRWQQRTKELNDTKSQLAAAAPKARQYDSLEEFRTKNSLTVENIIDGYKIMALIKNDPARAAAELEGIVGSLKQIIGDVLPDDLKTAVDAGEITQERAQELSRARAANARFSDRDKQTRDEQTRQQRQQDAQQVADRNAGAVMEWESTVRAKDPDFAKKEPLIADKVRAIIQMDRKYPANEAEAVALSERAYKEVNRDLGVFLPQRKPTPPAPRGVSVQTKPQPKTRREATLAALGRL